MVVFERDLGWRMTLIRLAPLLLLVAGCSGCEDKPANYGDTHTNVTDLDGFYWPTTGKVVQDFYGTESVDHAGAWYDETGALKYHAGGSNFHRGIDIENAKGTRVFASHSGTAFSYPLGNTANSGNHVIIRDKAGRIHTTYCHLDSIAISYGQYVTPNTVIGTMGDSGGQRRPHLHFNYLLLHTGQEWADYWTPGTVGEFHGSGEPMTNPIK